MVVVVEPSLLVDDELDAPESACISASAPALLDPPTDELAPVPAPALPIW